MLQVTPEIGSRVEICDPDGIWSSAVVIKKSQEEKVHVTVRYDGWGSRCEETGMIYDETLPIDSERLSKIYTHIARVKCLAILNFRKKKSKWKKIRINFKMMENGQECTLRIQNHNNVWPCILHTRVTESRHRETTAVDNLIHQKNVFVQPYRPELLPVALQNDWVYGGFWQPTNCINFFPFDPETKKTLLDGEFLVKQFRKDFKKAFTTALQDKSTPGYFKHDWDLYHEGSLLREEYYPVEPPEGTDEINNPLVDFTEWRDELVLLSSLDEIIPQSPVSKKEAKKKEAKKKEAKGKDAKKPSESVDETSYNNGLSVEDAIELAKANSLVDDHVSVQSYHQISGTRTSVANKSRSNSRSTTPIPGDSKMPALSVVPERSVLPTKKRAKDGKDGIENKRLKTSNEKNFSGDLKRGEEKNSKGDNVNNLAMAEDELDEISNTNRSTDHALNNLSHQAHSSNSGDILLDGMVQSISFANSNHGITTPTIDQLFLNASPINNHRMSLPFSIEELNRDMERNHDLYHPSTRNPSVSATNQPSPSNSAQQEIPPSGDQDMDVEGLTSPVIGLLGEVQTPSPYRNREVEARIAVANNLVHLRHSPILTSREQSPQNNTAAAQNNDGNTSNFDNTLFSGSNIQLPPRPSSAPPVLIPPRPSSAPPAIGIARVSFTTATSNHGRTIPTAAQNNNLLQRFSLGAARQQLATNENLPRVERGRQVAVAATDSASMRAASTVQQQQQVPVDRPRAEPAVRPQAAPINPPRPPVVEVQIPEHNAERHAQEREDELEEVSIEDDEEQQQPAVMQEPEVAQVQDQNNEPDEAQAQQANNEGEASQESDAEPNGHLSYVAGRARFYTEEDSSIENFVFQSGWGSENDSDDSTQPGVVEPFEAVRLRNLERQERQRRLREEQQ